MDDLPGLELVLDLLLHGLALGGIGHLFLSDDVLELQIILDDVLGGKQVVVVDELDEGLHPALFISLLLRHGAGHLARVPLNANDEGMAELLVLHKSRDQTQRDHKLTFLPSSVCLTMTAFLPACLPAVKMTTLPFFMLQ